MTAPRLTGRKCILTGMMLLALLLTACRSEWLDLLNQTMPSIVDVSFAERTETSTLPQTETETGPSPAATAPAGSPAASAKVSGTAVAPTPAAGFRTDTFDRQVRDLLLAGLQNLEKEIALAAAIPANTIPESDVQSVIDRIYAIYRDIYRGSSAFFYLDGSININYTLVRHQGTFLKTLTVVPQYWPVTANLSDSQLNSLIRQVNSLADQVAGSIRAESSQPWQQLQLVHDYLVKHVAYDSAGDQTKNQAISALLERITMCQGYAQAFQLIAERLGFTVSLISGENDGVGHAWNLVQLDGVWYHVDVTYDDPTPDGGESQPVQHIHFLRSDSRMRLTHQWTADDYPVCPKDGAQYYRLNNLTAGSQEDLENKIRQFLTAIDYSVKRANMLELLFTGQDIPDESRLEKTVQRQLSEAAAGHTVYYRQQVSKQVILVEITPG